MQIPEMLKASSKKLDVLSVNSANLAITSPQLGRLAGMSVVVLKACAVFPLSFTQLILAVGTTIANAFGSIGSSQCRADFKVSLEGSVFFGIFSLISPILAGSLIVKGFKGVWQNPTAPRIFKVDVAFAK